ncbi:MAG: thiamine biosynthesis protein ThiI [Candidatus Fermentimicrarchaeum limneticum]|uniref:Thiamine biosynthesis protein ThiI n=1 Tax=Fermentimicrarchaeum limneticum TaxID=2795018 RepID=A0A7D6B9J1_FERL1|nr:MAG: thiamine biosynthesis protein ThiI [Candidatus Fermentimicrarchaeum limneticum]
MLLVRYSEIMLKSRMTRVILGRMLERNIRVALGRRRLKVGRDGGLFYIETEDEQECADRLRKVFGVAYISVCEVVPAEVEGIAKKCVEIGREFRSGSSFAIRARRVGEHPFSSTEICVETGRRMLEELRNRKLKVDLEEPDEEVFVYVRERRAFISRGRVKAYGGMPIGSQGKVVAMINNRNSYLAAWMMMRRGCELIAVFSTKRGEGLAEKLMEWHIGRDMGMHDLRKKHAKLDGKRLLMEAGRIARESGALGVVSGGSVCSDKKLEEIKKLDDVAEVPVYRPLAMLEVEMVVA